MIICTTAGEGRQQAAAWLHCSNEMLSSNLRPQDAILPCLQHKLQHQLQLSQSTSWDDAFAQTAVALDKRDAM